MRKIVLFAALVTLVALAPPRAARATTPLGPICLSTAPFSDVLVWFLDSHGGTATKRYFDGTGSDVSGDRTQSPSAFISGQTLSVGYVTHPQPGFVPVIAGGDIDLATLSGPGECYAPDLASCGAFTFQIIACPAGALSGDAVALSGRIQGQ